MSKSSEPAPAIAYPIRGTKLPYVSSLDGLRALAIIGVLLYHADLPWFPGGFLGVDVFFVISGYLITSLLLKEWQQYSRVDLKNFWLRRARRLLPALFLVIASTLGFAVVFLPHEVAGLRSDALAAVGYVTNWYLIFHHQSYFETVGRPAMLQHLWSLAVEEQFYLLWPLLFIAAMRGLRDRYRLPVILAGAAASTVLMVFLYKPDVDPSRLYYGTDTRAAGFLIGAALAFLLALPTPGILEKTVGGRFQVWVNSLPLDLIGLGAFSVLGWSFVRMDGFQPFLYQGGFTLVALTTAVLIAVAIHPRARLCSRLLSWGPLRWIGLRSYGIYLWHWPVFMVTRPQLDVRIDGLPLLALRLVVTGVLAELSYHYIETPIRSGALGRAWNAWREVHGVQRWRLGIRWAGAAGVLVVLFVALGESVVNAQPPAPPLYLSVQSIDTLDPVDVATPVAVASDPTLATAQPTAVDSTSAPQELITPEAPAPTKAAAFPTATALPASHPQSSPTPNTNPVWFQIKDFIPTPIRTPAQADRVTAIGDSVMLGAAPELEQAVPNIGINAAEGRQVSAGIDILQTRRAAGKLGTVVLIHLGNNGTFTAKQFDQMMQVLAGVKRVVFVDVKVPRSWIGPNNTVLADGVKRYPNAVLVDWLAVSYNRPELFWSDGIHLRPEGARIYADLIATAIKAP